MAIFLVACGGVVEDYPAIEDEGVENATWQGAYAAFLREYQEKSDSLFFVLHDFGQTDTPELIVFGQIPFGDFYEAVYAFRDGQVIAIEVEDYLSVAWNLHHGRIVPSVAKSLECDYSLIAWDGHSGNLYYQKITLEGDRLVRNGHGSIITFDGYTFIKSIGMDIATEDEFFSIFGKGDTLVYFELSKFDDIIIGKRTFIDRIQINPNAPLEEAIYLTFHRIAIAGESTYGEEEFDVTILIYDDEGHLVQEISGLRQYSTHFNPIDYDWMQLSFVDLTFNGYLDMRLFSIFHSERYPGWGQHYHWLWDKEAGQFVFNDQLTELLRSVEVWIDEDAQLWSYSWSGSAGSVQVSHHFGYRDGKFVELRQQERNVVWLNQNDRSAFIFIDVDSWAIEDTREGGNPRIMNISIYNNNDELIQEMRYIRTNLHETHFSPPQPPRAVHRLPTFDIHFADYNDDGYLDLAVAAFTGGTMRNSPRLYWLWCPVENLFVSNTFLGDLSSQSTVSSRGDGTIIAQAYEGSGQWEGHIFRYVDGEFVQIWD